MLRRRKSFLDTRTSSMDIAFSGEIRGSVIPIRQTRSAAGKRRTPTGRSRAGSIGSRGNESSTELDCRASAEADETVMSDFGTMTGRPEYAHLDSNTSTYHIPALRRSLSTFHLPEQQRLNRRKTASAYNLKTRRGIPTRTNSMPVSPVVATSKPEMPAPPPLMKSASDVNPGHSQSSGDGSPVYALGSGFTNSERPVSTSRWGTLRRSLSFARTNRNSTISLMDLNGGSSTVDLADQTRSETSEESNMNPYSATTSGEDDYVRESPSSVPSTPKKKRNSLFQSLSRFTPI